jgi:hypothetical protein
VNEYEIERLLRAVPPDEPAYPGNIATLLEGRRAVSVPATLDLAPPSTRRRNWIAVSLSVAAAVAVLVAGLALLTRSREEPAPATAPPTTPSPTTTTATTTPDSTAPAAGGPLGLFDRWVGPPRPTPSAQNPTGPAIVDIVDDTLVFETGEFDNPTAFGSHVEVDGDTLLLTTLGEGGGCSPGDLGRYQWTVTDDQSTLTLIVESDACVARQAIAGSWTHTACPNPTSDCLGPVPAGTYPSVMFDPLGTASYGQLRFTLPPGWQESSDSKVNLTLETSGTTISVYAEPVVDPNCVLRDQQPVAGAPTRRLDLSTCSATILAARPDSPVAWTVASDKGNPDEVYVLDVGKDRSVAIVISGNTQLAQQIVNSFEFSA